ncbi:MAG: heme-copper oxidase subunit III [Acidobacteria bacterium]|nr:MAG: heme-copper oxidase subunit III [Acidobacteriota bacterium]
MATLSPTVAVKYPQTRHGGGSGAPPTHGNGGGDGRGANGSPDYGERLRRARLGLVVGLTPVIMLFVSFTSAYIVRKGLPTVDPRTNTYVHDWLSVNIPWGLLLVNTVILLISSVTMELARRQITRQAALAPVSSIPGVSLGEEKTFPWLGVTVVLGLGFLIGQWMAWQELAARGFYLATSASSSFVYLLTGMHAIHLAGGILALLFAAATSLLRKPVEGRRIVVDITAWYWHFMALLWIYIFALIEIAR